MDEQANKLVDAPTPEPAPKPNRGWFQRGDRRINRQGRPRSSKAADLEEPVDLALATDRLKVLFLPTRYLAYRLSHELASWITNLPTGYAIVGCRMDAARDAVVLLLRSRAFREIPQGAVIPEFQPYFNGQKWDRW